MFGIKSRKTLYRELTCAVQEAEEAKKRLRGLRNLLDDRNKEAATLRESLDDARQDAKEAQEARDALSDSLDQAHARERRLREGLGHLMNGMAACQALADGFAKRFDMLPNHFGLGEDLALELLKDFDKDRHVRKEIADYLEGQAITIEYDADDGGNLDGTVSVDSVADQVHAIVNEKWPDRDYNVWEWFSHDEEYGVLTEDDDAIDELGLYKIPLDLGKQVTSILKVWIVPQGDGPN